MNNTKYAVIKEARLKSGQIFISPTDVFDALPISKDRAAFGSDAYDEDYVVIELKVVARATARKHGKVSAQ